MGSSSGKVKTKEFEKNTLFHSQLHEKHADFTQIFHRTFESCVLMGAVKETAGVHELLREISSDPSVILLCLCVTSPPVSFYAKPRCPTFPTACNINPVVCEHVPPLSTSDRRVFAGRRRVSLNNGYIGENHRNSSTERAIPTPPTLCPHKES